MYHIYILKQPRPRYSLAVHLLGIAVRFFAYTRCHQTFRTRLPRTVAHAKQKRDLPQFT
jgi:hypothetical protein